MIESGQIISTPVFPPDPLEPRDRPQRPPAGEDERPERAEDDRATDSRLARIEELSSLRRTAGGVGRTSTVLQTADGAAAKVEEQLERLRAVAERAAQHDLDQAARQDLIDEFTATRGAIDAIAAGARFEGHSLFEAEAADDHTDDGRGRQFGPLGTVALGLDGLDVSTAERAEAAVPGVAKAAQEVVGRRDNLAAALGEVAGAADAVSTRVAEPPAGDAEALHLLAARLSELIRSQPGTAALATGNAAHVGVLNTLLGG